MKLRNLLSGLTALGILAGAAAAQGPGYYVDGHVWYQHVQTPPSVPPTNVGARPFTPTQYPPAEAYRERGLLRFLVSGVNSCGVGCWSHHDRPTCSSLRSELSFIFGSCRDWFGEPCMHGPPVIPAPTVGLGGYGPPPAPPHAIYP